MKISVITLTKVVKPVETEPLSGLSSTPGKNRAKYDPWLESLHIFIFDILFKNIFINRN